MRIPTHSLTPYLHYEYMQLYVCLYVYIYYTIPITNIDISYIQIYTSAHLLQDAPPVGLSQPPAPSIAWCAVILAEVIRILLICLAYLRQVRERHVQLMRCVPAKPAQRRVPLHYAFPLLSGGLVLWVTVWQIAVGYLKPRRACAC